MTLKKNIIFLLFIILTLQCSSYQTKNTFYSEAETNILKKTMDILEYGYGYDYQIELNYIYSYSFSKENLQKKERAFAEALDKADFKSVLALYEKIMTVQAQTDYKLDKFKKESKWKYYTYIKNDLLKPLEHYSSLLYKNILKKNSSLENYLTMKKESISKKVTDEYTLQTEVVDTF
ncbi:MAG: hypothetical protein JW864_06305 [Spirochaetes bacterium]|nr:hypothetical protein [Spirochaetota bacterium]